MRRTLLTAATALAALAPVVLVTTPADAESVTVQDARDDVVDGRFRVQYDPELVDIVSTTLNHTTEKVVVRLRMVKVVVGGRQALTAVARLATPDDTYTLAVEKQGSSKTVELARDGSDAAEDCAGLSATLLPAADQIVLSAPRSCLGDPESVRFGAGVRMSWPNPVNSYDDARRNGGVSPERPFDPRIGRRAVRPGEVG